MAANIERWLILEVANIRSPDWTWGCEAFWMAFIAAYPDFPRGDWPSWNTQIAIEGPFMERWMQRSPHERMYKPADGYGAEASDDYMYTELCISKTTRV